MSAQVIQYDLRVWGESSGAIDEDWVKSSWGTGVAGGGGGEEGVDGGGRFRE